MKTLFHSPSAKLQNCNTRFVFLETIYDDIAGFDDENKRTNINRKEWNPLAILKKGEDVEEEAKQRVKNAKFEAKAENFGNQSTDAVFACICEHIESKKPNLSSEQNQLITATRELEEGKKEKIVKGGKRKIILDPQADPDWPLDSPPLAEQLPDGTFRKVEEPENVVEEEPHGDFEAIADLAQKNRPHAVFMGFRSGGIIKSMVINHGDQKEPTPVRPLKIKQTNDKLPNIPRAFLPLELDQ